MLKVPLKKMERNDKTVVFFLILLFLGVALNILFILPMLDSEVFAIIYGLINVLILINFTIAGVLCPGYVKPNPEYNFQALLNKLDPIYLCPECKIIRTPRSRHCNMCNRCVERYDHH